MKIKPLGDRLIVRPLTDEEKMSENDLGIILPDSMKKDNEAIAIIDIVGPDVKNKELKVGTQVMLTSMMMKQSIEVNGTKGQLIKEGEIVAIIED